MLAAEGEDLPLDHGALDVVVLKHDVLLQALDGVVAAGGAELGQEHLAKAGREEFLAFRIFSYHGVVISHLPFPRTFRKEKSSTPYFRNFGLFLTAAAEGGGGAVAAAASFRFGPWVCLFRR